MLLFMCMYVCVCVCMCVCGVCVCMCVYVCVYVCAYPRSLLTKHDQQKQIVHQNQQQVVFYMLVVYSKYELH